MQVTWEMVSPYNALVLKSTVSAYYSKKVSCEVQVWGWIEGSKYGHAE